MARTRRGRRREGRPRHRKLAPMVGLVLSAALLATPLLLDLASRVSAYMTIGSMSASAVAQDGPVLADSQTQAEAYNAGLGSYEGPSVQRVLPYGEQLSYRADGAMGWVEVPKAGIRLPIYHGTSEDTLARGVGHLENSSLPVGGRSSHCVLTAHSGMPDMSAFDEIRRLGKGDMFYLHTLGVTYAYRVYDVEVVLPEDVSSLRIQPGRDLCTLVTCTPYGVNDHRLLVHGERMETDEGREDHVEPEALLNVRTVPVIVLLTGMALGVVVACRRRHVARRKAPKHLSRRRLGRRRRNRAACHCPRHLRGSGGPG